jgi:hypothetical protein
VANTATASLFAFFICLISGFASAEPKDAIAQAAPLATATRSETASVQEPQAVPASPNSESVLLYTWTKSEICNLGNAEAVRFAELARNSRRYEGRCLVVNGFWRGRGLFTSGRAGSRSGAFWDESLANSRIGLYAHEDILDQSPRSPTRARMIGILRHCDTAFQGYAMVMGYCHYTGGPILILSEAQRN